METAKEMFQKMKENQSVPANLKQLVFSIGVKTGSDEDWTWCYEKYKNTNIPSDRSILLHALGETNNIFTIQKYGIFFFKSKNKIDEIPIPNPI